MKALSPNHWNAREFPGVSVYWGQTRLEKLKKFWRLFFLTSSTLDTKGLNWGPVLPWSTSHSFPLVPGLSLALWLLKLLRWRGGPYGELGQGWREVSYSQNGFQGLLPVLFQVWSHHWPATSSITCKMKMWGPLFKIMRISRPQE